MAGARKDRSGARTHSATSPRRVAGDVRDGVPRGCDGGLPATFARFTEELGELAEALRVFPVAPGYFLSEAADVFAWLMHLQNLLHSKTLPPRQPRGRDLVGAFVPGYPDRCGDCGNPVCTCPPILPSTLGRIAHEVPAKRASFGSGGALLPIDEAMELFRASTRSLLLGGHTIEVDASTLQQVRGGVVQLIRLALSQKASAGDQNALLMDALYEVKSAAEAQRLTEETLHDLAEAIARMDSEGRSVLLEFLTGTASGAWAAARVELVGQLVRG